ncbi:hypothetical protein MIMGU_mgv1a002795mg [Erythranthe guttata]|uniref:EF-hand domain-containing protein n=1 Tax=Erythranthe guttata TaxID=4155 RepID=A0A022S197_ERYGU|nr:hypothetical protein MIMGU_mgv1a002795mg [Erythranthe guttata]
MEYSGEEEEEKSSCEQMYGFLPCSQTNPGHFFLILVYQYLLFHAESYVASGGKRIFKILGPGLFGASVFQIIGSLPEALILLASGLTNRSNETAEELVLTGVGLLAGSSILLLTLIWGTCVLLGRNGVSTLTGARNTSIIMLLSIIPLIMVQFPTFLRLSYVGERVFVLFTLVVSIVFLLCYFFYQFFKPSIQRRRLLYIKHEHLAVDILNHVQNQTAGDLLDENGMPDISTIKRLFGETDSDGDKVISFAEFKAFLQEIKTRKFQSDEENTAAEIMKAFDTNNDQQITEEEFVQGMTKLLDDTKDAMNKRLHSVKSLKDLYKVLKPWIEKKREEREIMKHLIPDIMDYLQNSVYGSLLADDRTPNIHAIKELFKRIDADKDGCLSYSELKEMMTDIKFGTIPYDAELAASKLMKVLDVNEDNVINEEEFVDGLFKLLNTTLDIRGRNSKESEDDTYQKTWEQTDKLLEEKFIDKSKLAWAKAIGLLLLGLVMLGLLAEPLIQSVRNFSKSAKVPSFYVAFVLVPLTTNARIAVSAVREARRKKLHLTSLTFSEIYSTVLMNNVLGLIVLLSLVYFRGLAWNYSAEILAVTIVSGIVGIFSSLSRIYPVWTSISAYLMYPLSLVLVYIFGHFYSSSS